MVFTDSTYFLPLLICIIVFVLIYYYYYVKDNSIKSVVPDITPALPDITPALPDITSTTTSNISAALPDNITSTVSNISTAVSDITSTVLDKIGLSAANGFYLGYKNFPSDSKTITSTAQTCNPSDKPIASECSNKLHLNMTSDGKIFDTVNKTYLTAGPILSGGIYNNVYYTSIPTTDGSQEWTLSDKGLLVNKFYNRCLKNRIDGANHVGLDSCLATNSTHKWNKIFS